MDSGCTCLSMHLFITYIYIYIDTDLLPGWLAMHGSLAVRYREYWTTLFWLSWIVIASVNNVVTACVLSETFHLDGSRLLPFVMFNMLAANCLFYKQNIKLKAVLPAKYVSVTL